MSSKNKTPLKKLFDYFDSFLIIDKSVDLLLIFVGLVAALAFENYVEQNAKEKQYVENLTRLHTEITANATYTEGYEKSVLDFFDIARELLELTNKGASESYDGIYNILDAENDPYEQNSYNSLSSEDFLNKELYSEVLHVYELYDKIEEFIKVPRESLKEFNYSYFGMYLHNRFSRVAGVKDWVDLNYAYNVTTKNLPNLQNLLIEVKITSERVAEVIENELIFYNTTIEKSRKYTDYYWLSWRNLVAEKYTESVDYAFLGLEALDNLNYEEKSPRFKEYEMTRGRLNRNIVRSYTELVKTDETNYNLDMTLPYFEEWKSTGVYMDQYYVNFLHYYFLKKDINGFAKTTKEAIDGLDSYEVYDRWVGMWKEYMITDTIQSILKSSKRPIEEWDKYINPVKEGF